MPSPFYYGPGVPRKPHPQRKLPRGRLLLQGRFPNPRTSQSETLNTKMLGLKVSATSPPPPPSSQLLNPTARDGPVHTNNTRQIKVRICRQEESCSIDPGFCLNLQSLVPAEKQDKRKYLPAAQVLTKGSYLAIFGLRPLRYVPLGEKSGASSSSFSIPRATWCFKSFNSALADFAPQFKDPGCNLEADIDLNSTTI